MRTLLFLLLCSMIGIMSTVAIADAPDEPHLFYSPTDGIRLQLTAGKLPKQFRVCSVGQKFTFCSDWQRPKSREVEIWMTIPKETPTDDYHIFYEDKKSRIDLHHSFRVEAP